MEKIHISFGDSQYNGSLKALEESSNEYGSDKFITYTQDWLKTTSFWEENKEILIQPRGAGFWLWKPYIILETFKLYPEDTLVLYTDAAVIAVDKLSYIYDLCDNHDIVLFGIGTIHNNATWTKEDVFQTLQLVSDEYRNGNQVSAAFSLWKNTKKSREFLEEWLRYMRDPILSTDVPSKLSFKDERYKDNRHDQSILSLLSQRDRIQRYQDPSQHGLNDLHPNGNFPQIFDHHRAKL